MIRTIFNRFLAYLDKDIDLAREKTVCKMMSLLLHREVIFRTRSLVKVDFANNPQNKIRYARKSIFMRDLVQIGNTFLFFGLASFPQ